MSRAFQGRHAIMKTMILSIVVVNYNSRSELESFFPSVYRKVRAEVPEAEFIIVDNASSDGSAAFVRENFPGVILHVEPGNIFFGPAANLGVALAQGDLVLLLNPDVAVDHLGFHAVLSRFRNDPRLFALHPHIHDPRDGQEERLFSLALRRGIVDARSPVEAPEVESMEIPFVTGGAAFFRRSLFLEMGGFDPIFSPFYWEDVDLGIRAVRSGFVNLFLPSSRFLHWHSTIIRRNYDERKIKAYYERNRLLFLYKHVSLFSLPFLSHLFWLLPRLLHSLAGNRLFLDGFRSGWAMRKELRQSRRALGKSRPIIPFASVISRFRAFGNG
jgi:GT2 family glycosyltransferase